jgi:hypothetical protein
MNKSESIKSLALALANAQAEFTAVPFNAVNPFFKTGYADLGSIIQSAKPILAKNGLSVSQLAEGESDSIGITTMLIHSSGEWISSTISLPVTKEAGKSSAQAAGSVITYLRRYALASVLGLYADEDNDAEEPKAKSATKPEAKPEAKAEPGKVYAERPLPTMSLEFAEKEKASDGTLYINMDNEKLTHMVNAMLKAIKGADADKQEEYNRKIMAARTIIESRK